MEPEFSIVEFIKNSYPISTITLIMVSVGFLKSSLVCGVILRFQERRIKFLEKQIEDVHK